MTSKHDIVGWMPDPNGRGTSSVIISCVLTIGLCVWSALHLNIPSPRQTTTGFWLRNLKWMGLGLLIPELVVYAAWRQFNSSKTLQLEIRKAAASDMSTLGSSAAENEDAHNVEVQSADLSIRSRATWSVVHGFYAGMGGFVFELDATSASMLSPSYSRQKRFTLTPRGTMLLGRCGLLPTISRRDIEDKSKADGLAKSFVCLQAGWMVVQVLARVASSLPVTLLEVNTLGHIVCAFAIYLLWWYKPRLIREPTIVEGDAVVALCTFMWMSSRISDPRKIPQYPFFAPQRFAELKGLVFRPCDITVGRDVEAAEIVQNPTQSVDLSVIRQSTSTERSTSLKEASSALKSAATSYAHRPGVGYLGPGQSVMAETHEHLPDRWKLVLQAMETFPATRERVCPASTNVKEASCEIQCEELLTSCASNWPSEGLLRGLRGLMMGMALWFVTIAYGAVHVAAWDSFFPSHVERWLWRTSSIYIMGSGLLWLCVNALGAISSTFDAYWERLLARKGSTLAYAFIGFLCTICGFAYRIARLYLVVESVISLRRLPANAYQTPDWSQLIPHL